MNRGIYSTVSGMLATQKLMDVMANNLANVSTTGFKRDGITFTDALEQEMRSGGNGQVLGTLGTGTTEGKEFTIFDVGPTQITGRPLDMMINEPQGMFAVQTPQGVRYTRDGSFVLDNQRQLVTTDGFPVLDSRQQPITIPEGQVSINETGDISVAGSTVGTVGIYNGSFLKEGGNLYSSPNGAPLAGATMKPEALEGSNVNPIDSMIQMIQVGRSFDLSQKTIQQQDDLTQRLIQSLSTR